ncbi:MAG: DUF3429 domain-containing protein [Sphingomicrobium sp.]
MELAPIRAFGHLALLLAAAQKRSLQSLALGQRKTLTHHSALTASGRISAWSHGLGLAGLLPQLMLAATVILGAPDVALVAGSLALSYAALILSFVGGAWWGLISRSPTPVRGLVWVAAVAPSLIAFTAILPLAFGLAPLLAMLVIGTTLIGTLAFDHVLAGQGLCPLGWVRLRTPLSLGLGSLTLLIAIALLARPTA